MQSRTFRILRTATAAAGLLLGATQSQAQYANMENMQRRLSELEQQVATMQQPGQSRLTSTSYYDDAPQAQPENSAGGCGDSCCNDGCCLEHCRPRSYIGQDFLNTGCRSCGPVFGAELLFLKPVATNGGVPGQATNVNMAGGGPDPQTLTANRSSPYKFETSPRFWLGLVGQNGLGFRVVYWEFDHSAQSLSSQTFPGGSAVIPTAGSMRFRTFDWEATQQVDFRRWRMMFFGGFRYAELALGQSQTQQFGPGPEVGIIDARQSFHGIGLTGGANLYRSLFNSDSLGWYTNARGSFVYGDRAYSLSAQAPNTGFPGVEASAKFSGDTIGILEISTGPQWQKPLQRGGYFFVRGGFEGQLWINAGTADDNLLFNALSNQNGNPNFQLGSLGLAGFGLATGIVR